MGFFGGMGGGKGWHVVRAVVTPSELERALETDCVLVHVGPVPDEYDETSRDEYVAAYSRLCEHSAELESASHQIVSSVRATLSRTRELFSTHPSKLDGVKVLRAERPVVNIGPGSLFFESTVALGVQSDQATAFGIELSFPMVAYLDDEDAPRPDTDLENYSLFAEVSEALRTITHPLRIR